MNEIVFEGSRYPTYGSLPSVGSRAPDISLVDTELRTMSLANFPGKRKILHIFPSIDMEACAKSVVRFDKLAKFSTDLVLLMVSYDLPFAHKRFGREHGLGNTIGLSAIRHEGFGENYGVLIQDGPLKGMYACAVVVLDENNTVVHTEQIEVVGGEPDYIAAYQALGIDVDPEEIED